MCRLGLDELVARLSFAHAREEFSCLLGARLLVVDIDDVQASLDQAEMVRAGHCMLQLACPTVALTPKPPPPELESFVDCCDVRVQWEAQLECLSVAAETNPIAALAMVQLLRMGEALSIGDGLVAESFVYSTLQGGPEFAAWLARHASTDAAADPGGPTVLVERNGQSLTLVLNRPARHNAYSAGMRDGLVAGLELALSDASISEIVLRANGPSFCSGGDLAEFATTPDPATAHAVRSTRSAARLLCECGERVRVELHGACIGAGIELAAFARRVVARADTFFELPEVSMGLVPGAGGSVSIASRIGRQRTAYMALSGARVDAETALGWGLIDEITKQGEPHDAI